MDLFQEILFLQIDDSFVEFIEIDTRSKTDDIVNG